MIEKIAKVDLCGNAQAKQPVEFEPRQRWWVLAILTSAL